MRRSLEASRRGFTPKRFWIGFGSSSAARPSPPPPPRRRPPSRKEVEPGRVGELVHGRRPSQ